MTTYSLNQTHPDIKKLQRALNEILKIHLKPDGQLGRITQDAIMQYQSCNCFTETDKFGVCYGPITQAKIGPYIEKRFLTESDFIKAAAKLAVPVASVKAICEVEAKEFGFLDNGEPQTLFERHIFYKEIAKKLGVAVADKTSASRPDICNKQAGGYIGAAAELKRLSDACALFNEQGLMSASYGLFQICGFNYKTAGYKDVFSYYEAMRVSEDNQLDAVVNFILADSVLYKALLRQDWAEFALGYNGSGYKTHTVPYDIQMATAFKKFS